MTHRSLLNKAGPVLLSGLTIGTLTRVVTIQLHPIRTETRVAVICVLGSVDTHVGAKMTVTPCLNWSQEPTGEDLQVHGALDVVLNHLDTLARVQLVHLVNGSPRPIVPDQEVLVDSDSEWVSSLE